MAEIAPFRGILYDPARVDATRVLAPPYDVISEDERARLEALDPHNCVRLILPRPGPHGDGDGRYATAAELLRRWMAEGTLRRDARPALYRYHQVFTSAELEGREVTRRGLIAAGRLHRYEEAVVKPHERTLRGPKEDRLKLMRACRAHLSQIFMLYSDPQRQTDRAFAAAEGRPPDLEGKTFDGTVHRLWRVDDAATIATVRARVASESLYIADGHHRYETMLALRDELRAAGATGPRSTIEFGAFFLANMDDPGLVVLPTHRLVHSLPAFDAETVLRRAADHFAVSVLSGGATQPAALKARLAQASATRPTFALVVPGRADAWLLSLAVEPEAAGLQGPRALVSLDVTLLHALVLDRLLGIDREALEAQRNVVYVKDTRSALEQVARGEAQAGFIMHPTRVEQVRAVADAGEVMPQKSTFFYPKIASGLVVNPLDPAEALPEEMA